MSNFLENGSVLPYGLLGERADDLMRGFNKTYRNYPLRVGVVIASYLISDDRNHSKLTTEYDVSVIEQSEDMSTTSIIYRNCLAAQSFGSIADFLESTLRPLQHKTTRGNSINLNGQDGAVVLLQCLDGMSDKAIIIGALNHPNRPTNLITASPFLEGEYNGVNFKINSDGSASLTFNGATDNQGNPIDASQGPTTAQIQTDGSVQIQNAGVTLTLSKNGQVTLNATGEISITAIGNTVIEGETILLGESAAEAVIKGDTFKALYNAHQHLGNLGAPTSPPLVQMDPSLSTKVFTE